MWTYGKRSVWSNCEGLVWLKYNKNMLWWNARRWIYLSMWILLENWYFLPPFNQDLGNQRHGFDRNDSLEVENQWDNIEFNSKTKTSKITQKEMIFFLHFCFMHQSFFFLSSKAFLIWYITMRATMITSTNDLC